MVKVKAGRPTVDIAKLCYTANRPLLLQGPHGIGKSEILKQAADELGIGFICRDLSLMEPPDLVGLPKANGKTTQFLPPEFLPRKGNGFLAFEELNRCQQFMQAPCLQLMTARTLNDYCLPVGWLPVAAINPANGPYEVTDLDAALLSRFVQIDLIADHREWLNWARNNGIHSSVLQYVRSDSTVFNNTESNPRAWKYLSDIVSAFDADGKTPDQALRAAVIGTVGPKRGAAFLKFFRGADRPLTAEEVLTSYAQQRKLVLGWIKKGQLDLVKATLLAVKKHLQPKREYEDAKAARKQWSNLTRFIYDLPGDLRDDAKEFFDERQYTFPRQPKK